MNNARKFQLLLVLAAMLLISGCQTISIDFTAAGDESPDEVAGEHAAQSQEEEFSLIPAGLLVNTGEEDALTYVDASGQIVGDISTPGIVAAEIDDAALGGRVVSGETFTELVYRAWTPEQALMVNINGKISTLRSSNTFLALAASPDGALAFAEVRMTSDNYPHGYLYAGTIETIANTGSFYDLVDAPNYMVITPVAVESTAGEPQGVFYTKAAWGIGGADLIFPINRGLYFFDLTSGDNMQVISEDRSFQGISPDMSMSGYVDYDLNGNRSMTVRSIQNGTDINFPLDPKSDRGAGFAVFSPDNGHTAWLEAAGSMISDPYDFQPFVRIGEISSGEVVHVIDDAMARDALNAPLVTFMRPAGWLTNDTLLVEVRGENWSDASLLSYNISTGDLSVFTSGSFVGFAY